MISTTSPINSGCIRSCRESGRCSGPKTSPKSGRARLGPFMWLLRPGDCERLRVCDRLFSLKTVIKETPANCKEKDAQYLKRVKTRSEAGRSANCLGLVISLNLSAAGAHPGTKLHEDREHARNHNRPHGVQRVANRETSQGQVAPGSAEEPNTEIPTSKHPRLHHVASGDHEGKAYCPNAAAEVGRPNCLGNQDFIEIS